MIQFPPHKAGLTLEHNDHKCLYETVAEYAEGGHVEDDEWVSDAERLKAIETNELWVLQWYPSTPVGFYKLAASTLDALLEAANSVEGDK